MQTTVLTDPYKKETTPLKTRYTYYENGEITNYSSPIVGKNMKSRKLKRT